MYAMRKELNQYRQAGPLAEVAVASPHRLIQMLFEGAIERIAVARGAMTHGNLQTKGEQLSKAINIIESLRAALDQDKGGELAENLDALYSYMSRRLLEGNARNEPEALDEVSGLLRTIKSGWDEIPERLGQ
ncbi:flagellar export chaperone FliS [Marichromatium gracile]|uniref:Flagellar secretion chaperone FliS n=1 Tax=Marichromatium gracile TaxID=1048 RepID=A0A4R4A406_MARGR|nr:MULTISPECIES: flagellar export chaperone FliS [Marichromatium]MBO8086835.1 flagellar export chaperone FliS [Marichromatium sp.]MBK1709857.1 flagellar export chaperone FliS [Marichromatium gracile]MCF1183726.1 flagellar export chaperone FliS [Marichromatium gracile]RNE89286.1 flagella export chaperone FliS [Marichromatium sp. AB31]RNE92898.1 flagella export chaperone FliS [Marichromatium sp. AB32]